jgi:hypothetical protein
LVPNSAARRVLILLVIATCPWIHASEPISRFIAPDRIDGNDIRIGQYRGDPVLTPPAAMHQHGDRKLRLVQLTGRIQDGWRAAIEDRGIEVLAYVPNNAYLVWAGEDLKRATSALDDLGFVRWQGPMPPSATRGHDLDGRVGLTEVLILYFADPTGPDIGQQVATFGGTLQRSHAAQPDGRLQIAVATVPAEQLEALGSIDPVVWIEPAPGQPALGGEMSSVVVSGALDGAQPSPGYRSWLDDAGYDGDGVLWAVVDSGVDPLHPDLVGLEGISYPGCETDLPGDDPGFAGHGTPVASIVLGTAVGGFTDPDGFLWGLGVAPGARLLSQNALCDADVPWPPTDGWQILSRDGVVAGAIGSNNSWNSQEGIAHGYQISERVHDLMVRDGNFDTPEIAEPYILVFNAGNQGPDPSTIPAPKEAKNLITVGAIDNWRVSGNLHSVVEYSSRGPTLDGRIFPTVVAPGRGVGGAQHRLGGFYGPLYEVPDTDGLYMSFEGTSAAAPHVSGMLAVVTEWWRATRLSLAPSPAAARALVVNAAVPLDQGPPVPNFDVGWGLADLGRIVSPPDPLWVQDQTDVLRVSGSSWRLELAVADPSRPLRVTLAWTDDAAAAGADPTLVNDLDLVVETSGISYLGNWSEGGWSVPGGQPDRLNNLEDVHIAAPGDSALVTVTAIHLPGDGVPYNGDPTDQDFALVCRNCRIPLPVPLHPTGRLAP